MSTYSTREVTSGEQPQKSVKPVPDLSGGGFAMMLCAFAMSFFPLWFGWGNKLLKAYLGWPQYPQMALYVVVSVLAGGGLFWVGVRLQPNNYQWARFLYAVALSPVLWGIFLFGLGVRHLLPR